jgi:hypothetical protein
MKNAEPRASAETNVYVNSLSLLSHASKSAQRF